MPFRKVSLLFFLAAGIALYSCNKGLDVQADGSFDALPLEVASPAGNPSTASRIALGRALFFDPVLSGTRQVSCASCHHPASGYADGLELSMGVNASGFGPARRFNVPNDIPFARRNAPTLLNVAFNGMDTRGRYNPAAAPMFFDNRVLSLEAQSLHPIASLEEMRGTGIGADAILDTVLGRLRNIPAYAALFDAAFGASAITAENLGKALAAYERTLIAVNAPFDRYMRGDASAMSAAQKRGMSLFLQNGCNSCHSGPMFSDYKLHVLGVPDNPRLPSSDAGANGTYAFRTPTLRNLRFTAPYMHNGVQATLPDVLSFYDRVTTGEGINQYLAPHRLDTAMRRRVSLNMDLLDFLEALSDDGFDRTVPASVPSGLPVGGI